MLRREGPTIRIGGWIICLIGLLGVTYGCQRFKAHPDQAVMSQASFIELWKTYTHCRTTEDPQAIFVDAMRLNQVSRTAQAELPRLLHPVKPFVSDLPTRLAVDPKSMAAACTLRAGQAATAIGWNDLAITLYQSLLRVAGESYYAKQAQEALAEVPRASSPGPAIFLTP
ncbi:MAG: hypothetical protein ACREJU_15935 [Nitrospiraceae bacterium]